MVRIIAQGWTASKSGSCQYYIVTQAVVVYFGGGKKKAKKSFGYFNVKMKLSSWTVKYCLEQEDKGRPLSYWACWEKVSSKIIDFIVNEKELSAVNREYIVSMKHENYKTVAMIITAAKTNMYKLSISAVCLDGI